jgi:hypothetical protein
VIAIVALFLATAFPSNDKTSWMRPESFHLVIGMPREDAMRTLESNGWTARGGGDAQQLVVDYTEDKTMTLAFEHGRLHSVRFELFLILHDAKSAFAEETAYLRATFGEPKKLKSKTIVLYDNALPNIMAVLSNDPKSEQGQKGVGMVVVRYYDPR